MSKITVKDLGKQYIERRSQGRNASTAASDGNRNMVLSGVNLEIEEGEMVCILGASGVGKSTLLRILAGHDNATSGEVLFNGRTITGPSSDNIYVYQQDGLLPWYTVWKNVEIGLRHIEDEDEKDSRIQEYIDLVGLKGFDNYYPHQLSGGMQRRAELARAMVINPDVLFMDEPFTGLDYLSHLKIREEVINMHSYYQKTTLMVTHFIDDALIMADRIVVLGERPAKVVMSVKLDFSRPRNIAKDKDLSEFRDQIFLMLGVSYVA
ncbi:ABC-type nitrate/sulfonate/bicarbonate transport system, ATPase component [hydrothermal vent metagenome]|uniref:ABC-type nitrate/sulfonate/bicarbonate transport system, ATPase component n=1 Tax=hydrothermal vent metagenome TaxID=652676 RepID=A0A3B1BHW4_9ZZZZ